MASFKEFDNKFFEKKFPVEKCTIKSKNPKEKGIYESDSKYLCLIFDKRFPDYRQIKTMTPYIWVGAELGEERFKDYIGYGWVDNSGQPYDNYENPITNWDEFVIGWLPYEEDNDNNYFVKI